MSEITKEELLLMLDVQGKNVAQMTIVAEQLKSIAETNKTIVAKLTNGMASDLKCVKNTVCGSDTEEGLKKICSTMRDNTKKSAQYVGFIALAVVIALALMQFVHWSTHWGEKKPNSTNTIITDVIKNLPNQQ